MSIFINGASGKQYPFEQYPFDALFSNHAAVYIYYSPSLEGLNGITINCPYAYIGETEDLRRRMREHLSNNDNGHNLCALAHGSTCLLVHYAPVPFVAQGFALTPKQYVEYIESDLLSAYKTPCNKKENTWTTPYN